ncbi:hypothetical protein CpipJ_CPIJ001274 [Culex quinquefasciatus]|uniref:Uncharacterized protein n=1 Tax=Culex quinquefasciatus TaxID=7176 RepID=B0W2M4_CULQU|nr:hypothetical protein CpipJ_CPIJ001274 [Culex quinquefasciatus]|eukprot:XP_001842943.1 hypothetical protein CpipJ_CPIJ001274 [Culex quinquefasciatus]
MVLVATSRTSSNYCYASKLLLFNLARRRNNPSSMTGVTRARNCAPIWIQKDFTALSPADNLLPLLSKTDQYNRQLLSRRIVLKTDF